MTEQKLINLIRETEEHIGKHYYENLISDYHIDKVPECLQYIYAEFAVGAGIKAIRIMQEIIGIPSVGIWDVSSIDALSIFQKDIDHIRPNPKTEAELIMKFHKAKMDYFQELVNTNHTFKPFYKGWKNSADHVLMNLKEYLTY